jgi:hypothetical protein
MWKIKSLMLEAEVDDAQFDDGDDPDFPTASEIREFCELPP